MQIQTVQYTTYKYNELPEEAKQKALEKHRDINVDHDWWLFDDAYYYAGREDYGIEINMREICFDLDRGSYLYFNTNASGSKYDKPAIRIVDGKKFLKKAGFNLRKVKHLIDNISITTFFYGGGSGRNIIECDDCTQQEDKKMQSCLDKFTKTLLTALRNDYEYLTSDESIIDTFEANEYDFMEDGSIFMS
jgi:hypothetical protein